MRKIHNGFRVLGGHCRFDDTHGDDLVEIVRMDTSHTDIRICRDIQIGDLSYVGTVGLSSSITCNSCLIAMVGSKLAGEERSVG